MAILVVDDEKLIRDVIKEYLVNEQMEVLEASDGKQAIDIVDKNKISLIIMDIMMPNMDGISAYKEIKKNHNIPCIILSARDEEYNKLLGFEIGIDDYVTKPFSPKELVARVKALLKRAYFLDDNISAAGITIDVLAHEVRIDNEIVELSPKEFELLKYFIQNKNIALSREKILNNIWGYDFYGDDRTVDTHIKTLRSHLGKYKDMIKTVRSVGYKFEVDKEK